MSRSTIRGIGARGQALIEFALILPLLFILVVNVVNFGGFFYAWITVANAARAGAQCMIRGGATIASPQPPTATQIYNAILADVSSLRNQSSLVVKSCINNNGTVSCTTTGTGTFSNPSADTRPEAPNFVMAWVDVKYTFQPFIPLFSFPRLGLYVTRPPTVVHRQAVMRMLQ